MLVCVHAPQLCKCMHALSARSSPCTVISFAMGFHSPHWQPVDAGGRAGQRAVTQLQHRLTSTREALQMRVGEGSQYERHSDADG